MKWNIAYRNLVLFLVLAPNIFVVIMGIESTPYTCAPMFGHYIDENTDLYLFKFEGVLDGEKTNLVDYYGKPEGFFIRHFFSKVYGSTKAISPFTNKLSESPEAFNKRMQAFFISYGNYLQKEYNKSFDKIDLFIKKVDQNRNVLMDYELLGFFDYHEQHYKSLYHKNK